MRRLIIFLVVSLLLLTGSVLLGCGVPTGDNVALIEQEDLPESLRRVTTTTSTSLPAAPRDVDYFLLDQPPELAQLAVKSVVRSVEASNSLSDLLEPMFAEDFVQTDTTSEGRQLINRVTEYSFVRVRRPDDSTVATVELETFDDRVPNNETLRDVAAQLVFTLTEFERVDAITIEIDGERESLPTTNEEGNTEDPVGPCDYRLYDPTIDCEAAEPD